MVFPVVSLPSHSRPSRSTLNQTEAEMREAFRNHIMSNPSDSFPHRVYADWLEEHNHSTEAFIHRLAGDMIEHSPTDAPRQVMRLNAHDLSAPIAPFDLTRPNPHHDRSVRKQLLSLAKETYPMNVTDPQRRYFYGSSRHFPEERIYEHPDTVRKLYNYPGDLDNARLIKDLLPNHPKLADIHASMSLPGTIKTSLPEVSSAASQPLQTGGGRRIDRLHSAREAVEHAKNGNHLGAFNSHMDAALYYLREAIGSNHGRNPNKPPLQRRVALGHLIAAHAHIVAHSRSPQAPQGEQ